MTSPVFIRPASTPRFCRLLTVGEVSHVTACRARMPAEEPVVITATVPPPSLFCGACRADFEARQRAGAAVPGPSVGVLGSPAELEPDPDDLAIALARADTEDIRTGRRPPSDPPVAWDGGWDPPSREHER